MKRMSARGADTTRSGNGWRPAAAGMPGQRSRRSRAPWDAHRRRSRSPAARRFAALLRTYRDEQASGAPPEERRALEREMIALAPALREHVRRI